MDKWYRLTAARYYAAGREMIEMYSYHWAGGVTKKRLRIAGQLSGQADLDGVFSFDNEGRMTSLTYPLSGGTLNYAFDQMGRPKELTQQVVPEEASPYTLYHLKDVLYGAAGELTQMKYFWESVYAYMTET